MFEYAKILTGRPILKSIPVVVFKEFDKSKQKQVRLG